MKDLYGLDLARYEYIASKIRGVGLKYGYSMIRTPILEMTDVFQRSIGGETDIVSKEMYTFMDKGGGAITLRPEGTAGVIRSVLSENMVQRLPVKLMYCGEMFRYDRPQKGRLRQFHQFGFESIGDKSPYTDGILISMASESLQASGIFDFKVLVNSLGDKESRESYTRAIVKYFSRHEASLSDESRARLKRNPLRILDSKNKIDMEICSMAPSLSDYLNKESGMYFERVCDVLTRCGVQYDIDKFLVRGLDYYTHTAFEIKSTSRIYKDSLGGGGRYDKLLSALGGPDVSGIGLAFGLERLMIVSENKAVRERAKKAAVIPVSDSEIDDSLEVFKTIHANDMGAEFIHLGSLGKKMKSADRLNCEIALIIGETEKKDKTVTVKFMNETDESLKARIIDVRDVVKFLKHAFEMRCVNKELPTS
jgi:histidyl-tRNA synthetase